MKDLFKAIATRRTWVPTFASLIALSGCGGGGGGGGNVTLTTDNQGNDPVVVEVPVAYVQRPLPDEPFDLRDPISFNPGARLFVRDRAATSADDKDLTTLITAIVAEEEGVAADTLAVDVKDIDASFDGSTLIFAARVIPEPVSENLDSRTWNLWTYDLAEGVAAYVIPSRIKRNEGVEAGGGHDMAPHFLPDDRIVFSSTRQVASQARQLNEGRGQLFAALDEDGRNPAAVLHLYDPRLRDEEFTQISFNLSHDLDPVVLSSGEIVFSRWNNTGTDHISLYRIDPAGFGLSPLYGFHSANSGTEGSQVVFTQARETDDGRLVSVIRQAQSNSLGGNIVTIDTTGFADFDVPLWENPGAAGPGQTPLSTREVRTDGGVSAGGQFGSVYALRDGSGRFLVTWSDCRVVDEDTELAAGVEPADGDLLPCVLQPDNQRAAPPLYGAWVYDPIADTQRPVVLPREGSLISEVIAIEPRNFSSLVPLPEDYDDTLAARTAGRLLIHSVYDVDGMDASPAGISAHAQPGTPAHATRPARFLRLIQPVPIPDDDVYEIPDYASGVAGGFREILGYVPVEPDGSVTVTVPANRPFSFAVLDSRGRRIGADHDYWLQLAPGETRQCTGCHEAGSRLPHGRTDSQPESSNPGAVALNGGTLGFPGTRSLNLFATQAGESMAQVWDFHRPLGNATAIDRELTTEPQYEDEWHAADVTPDAAINDRAFPTPWPPIANERPLLVNDLDPGQPGRIVINYIDHIQPIWERTREAIFDADGNPVDTCIGCHDSAGDTVVAAGQLDLSSLPSDLEPNHYRSYSELLMEDNEQWLSIDDALVDRQRLCSSVDETGNTVTITESIPLASAMSGGTAAGSQRFFDCFEGGDCGRPDTPPLPANCTEDDGVPVPATRNTVNHEGTLSEPELRLLSDWLDIGAQYYNNPFDTRLAE
ncbi:MAG: hypothetical protein AAGA91_04700 [Pseudomonadota bacterium]